MAHDPWHYPRTVLAQQILGMFETGLSSSLVFFAPRRMGKTEFLYKDILPVAKASGWKVLYFSFLDADSNASIEFTKALLKFSEEIGIVSKAKRLLKHVNKVSAKAGGIQAAVEFNTAESIYEDVKEIIQYLAKQGKILLLMDEVQVLAQDPDNAKFVAALRTALDLNKDTVKVVFTGSSQEGLRRMFSQAKAPFFHFGQNLPFPHLERDFTDHLANMFEKITQRKLNTEHLWEIFQEMQKVPQLARSLVERLALNPGLSITQANKQLLAEVVTDRAFAEHWDRCSTLEKLLLHEVATDSGTLFSTTTRQRFAKILGINNLSTSTVQSAVRTLMRKNLIGRHSDQNGNYYIEDAHFKSWLSQLEI